MACPTGSASLGSAGRRGEKDRRDSWVAKRVALERRRVEKRPRVGLMLKQAIVLTFAVAFALLAAWQVVRVTSNPAWANAPAQAAPATPVLAADQAETTPASDAQVVKATDGHYWAEAEVNGRWIHCLIDTGASYVALTRDDAERLGIATAALDYSVPVATAHGQGMAARVDLDYVAVAGARIEHVQALVAAEGLSTSLLGMTYLGRLSRFEATPTSLILRP